MKIECTEEEFMNLRETIKNLQAEDSDKAISKTLARFNIKFDNVKIIKKKTGMYEILFEEDTVNKKFKHFNATGGAKMIHDACSKIMKIPSFITDIYTKHFKTENKRVG